MTDMPYWLAFIVKEPDSSFVIRGPFSSNEEANLARYEMKKSLALDEYVTAPFVAKDEDDAKKRAHLF